MAKEGKELAAEQSSGGMNDLVLAIRKRQARPPAPLAVRSRREASGSSFLDELEAKYAKPAAKRPRKAAK